LRIKGLFNVADDAFVNNATVIVTVKDSAGNEVSGQVWPTTMDYVAASNGNYRAVIEDDAGFVAGDSYTAHITADDGGSIGFWKFPFIPKTRTNK
jgi:hypothetical protein